MTIADNTMPALPCSMAPSVCADDHRSFFRILMAQPSLPAIELRPLMAAQLRKVLALYKSKRATTTDATTRDFYDYQIHVINKTLTNK